MKFVELLELINDCRAKAEKQGWIVYDIIGCYAEPLGNGFFRTVTQEEFINIFKGANKMEDFKQYRRTQIAEMRPVTEWDIKAYQVDKEIHSMRDTEFKVSISDVDRQNGSPKIGDMIARNPKNHNDQWLVAKQYFENNFEPM